MVAVQPFTEFRTSLFVHDNNCVGKIEVKQKKARGPKDPLPWESRRSGSLSGFVASTMRVQ
jgi:hypothetical protein